MPTQRSGSVLTPATAPTQTSQPVQPTQAVQPTPAEVELDRRSAASVAAWMAAKLEAQEFLAIAQVSDYGASFVPPGMGFNRSTSGSGEDFAQELEQAARGTRPLCVGYEISSPDSEWEKLRVVFSNMPLDLSRTDHPSDITGFLFMRNGANWDLVVVVPENDASSWGSSGYLPCSG